MSKTVHKKKFRYILGIQSYASHDSGACIIKFDDSNKFLDFVAISEDRLVRKKHTYAFPVHSIYACMKHFNLNQINEISYLYSDWIKIKKWLRSGPGYNYQMYDYLKEKFRFNKKNIIQINHHLCHAASTFYSSGFKKSAILVIDGLGSDNETHSIYRTSNQKINLISKYKHRGIGALYSAITTKLGLGFGGEGKTMGLAPYGKNKLFFDKIKFKGIETNFSKIMFRHPLSDVLNHKDQNYRRPLLKIKVKDNKKKVFSIYQKNLAFSIQDLAEKTMIHLGNYTKKITDEKKLCMAGGVALNSVANNKILKNSKFRDLFVFPACSDAGIPFGAAIWGYYNHLNNTKKINFINAYTGPNHNFEFLYKLLKKFKIKSKPFKKDFIAKKISEGKVIGRCVGRSEYGPRALGNRSILADPRSTKMRDYLNKHVKHREMFRPFAPVILENYSLKYFDIKKSPFMLQVSKVKKLSKIPSACHIDGTARVQTVNKKQNKNLFELIDEFRKITGIPCLLNTSFNDAGEPIVETYLDALISFLSTKIDILILEDIIIEKNDFKNLNKILKKLKVERARILKNDEKNAKKILFKKLDIKEFKKKKLLNDKLAIQEVLIKPFKKYRRFAEKIKDNISQKILIIGTNDHTNTLIKLFDIKKKVIADYLEIKENDVYKKKKKIKYFNTINKISIKYDLVLVSSYEYQYEIEKKFSLLHLSEYKRVYNNRNRSLIDYAHINLYGSNFPIYSKKVY
jgi:carbamoyltransferase